MTRSPDNERDIIVMEVPIRARASRTMLVKGKDLPTRVMVGAPEIPGEIVFGILNRSLPQGSPVYDEACYLADGMVRLHAKPLQAGDQTSSSQAGATVGMGDLKKPLEISSPMIVAPLPPFPTAAWRVTTADLKALLVMPSAFNSFDVRDHVQKQVHAQFIVERIDSGSMVVASDPCMPGWPATVTPTLA